MNEHERREARRRQDAADRLRHKQMSESRRHQALIDKASQRNPLGWMMIAIITLAIVLAVGHVALKTIGSVGEKITNVTPKQ